MNSTSPKFLFFSLLFLATMVACDTQNDERHATIIGKWYIAFAERNNAKINTLEGTVFEFTNDKQLVTNIPQIGSGKYRFKGDKIVQDGASNVEYSIEELTKDKLVLNTQIKSFDFKLIFTRDSIPQ
jgi:predicted HTH transcriptional regulator